MIENDELTNKRIAEIEKEIYEYREKIHLYRKEQEEAECERQSINRFAGEIEKLFSDYINIKRKKLMGVCQKFANNYTDGLQHVITPYASKMFNKLDLNSNEVKKIYNQREEEVFQLETKIENLEDELRIQRNKLGR